MSRPRHKANSILSLHKSVKQPTQASTRRRRNVMASHRRQNDVIRNSAPAGKKGPVRWLFIDVENILNQ